MTQAVYQSVKSNGKIEVKDKGEVELKNKSVAPINLNYTGEYTFHNDYKYIELSPKSSKTIYIKTKEVKTTINLKFEILNYVVGPKTNLIFSKNINTLN